MPELRSQILFYGAGSSAVGVALAIENLLTTRGGLSKEQAQKVRRNRSLCGGSRIPVSSSQGVHLDCIHGTSKP